MKNYAPQTHWDESYKNTKYSVITPSDSTYGFIKKYFGKQAISDSSQMTCFEIGCYPGNLLSLFGEMGYEINGIDATPRVEKDFIEWLKKKKYKIGKVVKGDFFKSNFREKFDVVCSFGFVEHFDNYQNVIKKHIPLVKDGGYIMISAPNFRGGFQQLLHKSFDRKNLSKHYLPSMNPKEWANILQEDGFEILFCGFYGGFAFWVDDNLNDSKLRRGLALLITKFSNAFHWIPSSSFYAPYCGLVAKKNDL